MVYIRPLDSIKTRAATINSQRTAALYRLFQKEAARSFAQARAGDVSIRFFRMDCRSGKAEVYTTTGKLTVDLREIVTLMHPAALRRTVQVAQIAYDNGVQLDPIGDAYAALPEEEGATWE